MNAPSKRLSQGIRTLFLVALLMTVQCVSAASIIAVTDFELNDITSLANTPQEIQRTAAFQPMLVQALKRRSENVPVAVKPATQQAVNPGFGYLFSHPDAAALLGRQLGADWVVIGQHSKPSYLFSYLIVNLVNVSSGKLAARFAIEMKGNHSSVSERGVNRLARNIDRAIHISRVRREIEEYSAFNKKK